MNKCKMEKMIKEIEKKMNKDKQSNKGLWIGIGVAVVATLVGVVFWLKSKNDEYIEEYYEYFDDDLEDEVEEDLYNEENQSDEEVEYVQIKNFAEAADEEVAEETAKEESVEEQVANDDTQDESNDSTEENK